MTEKKYFSSLFDFHNQIHKIIFLKKGINHLEVKLSCCCCFAKSTCIDRIHVALSIYQTASAVVAAAGLAVMMGGSLGHGELTQVLVIPPERAVCWHRALHLNWRLFPLL